MTGGMNSEFGVVRALGLVSQLGLVMSIPVVSGVMLGRFLDERLRGGGVVFLLLGLLVGLLAGGLGVAGLLRKELRWK